MFLPNIILVLSLAAALSKYAVAKDCRDDSECDPGYRCLSVNEIESNKICFVDLVDDKNPDDHGSSCGHATPALSLVIASLLLVLLPGKLSGSDSGGLVKW